MGIYILFIGLLVILLTLQAKRYIDQNRKYNEQYKMHTGFIIRKNGSVNIRFCLNLWLLIFVVLFIAACIAVEILKLFPRDTFLAMILGVPVLLFFAAGLVIFLGIFIARKISLSYKLRHKYSYVPMQKPMYEFYANAIGKLVTIFACIVGLSILQINAIVLMVGVLGIGIFFLITNFDYLKKVSAGIAIAKKPPFGIGDKIKFDDVEGQVMNFTLEYTSIKLADSNVVKNIDNKILINSSIEIIQANEQNETQPDQSVEENNSDVQDEKF